VIRTTSRLGAAAGEGPLPHRVQARPSRGSGRSSVDRNWTASRETTWAVLGSITECSMTSDFGPSPWSSPADPISVGTVRSLTIAGKSTQAAAQVLAPEAGRLAVVRGVGSPNRSHFQRMAIWRPARFDAE
jgi:hypothetical protein